MTSPITTSLCQMKSISGTHRVKIQGQSLTRVFSSGESIQCGTFTVGEYQWAILYYPNGQERGSGYIAFDLQLLSAAKDVRVSLRFSLVDQSGIASPNQTKSNDFTFRKRGDHFGFYCFTPRNQLLNFLKDDSFIVECSLEIIIPIVREGKKNSISVPPSNIIQHFHHLLQNGEGANISFNVKGEIFRAHRFVLAARSSVFRAELLGSMKESQAESVEINDMEPQVFKALLQFIYTDDMLFPSDESVDEDIMAQHLLIAADRYDLKRLRLICEEKLVKKICSDNVVTTLALAARHNCNQLKEICLDYISSSEMLHSFTEADVFASFMVSNPSIYRELLQKVAGNRRT